MIDGIRSATIQELDVLADVGASQDFINARLREGSTLNSAATKLAAELFADNRRLKIRVLTLEGQISADTGGPNGRPADKGTGDSRGKNSQRDEDAARGTATKAADKPDDDQDDDTDSGGTSATTKWNAAVAEKMKTRGMTKAKAIEALTKSDKSLHAAMLKEANAAKKASK